MLPPTRRSRHGADAWPAFVDVLAALLLVLVFMLLVFVLGQVVLGATLAGRERELEHLGRQLDALAETLASERAETDVLRARAGELRTHGDRLQARARALAGRERRLDEEVERLRQELWLLDATLQTSEEEIGAQRETIAAQRDEIAQLGERLDAELARRVQELERYRSEFFGRLRAILGDHPSIRIVGDRFVVQSELLFPSGSARIVPEGRQHLAQLAATLEQVTAAIPEDIDWVLRIDGHTDRRPIHTEAFVSNWELSTARALAVVRVLIDRGIPPRRLAATGFGEHHPIDPGVGEEAFARNRRIEIKLTRR